MFDYIVNNPVVAYMLVVVAVVFSFAMSAKVNSTFRKYEKVNSRHNVPANVIARQILDSYGLYNVGIQLINKDKLTNYYDPRNNTISLSESVFYGTSVGAIGIAAHECGHAAQYAKGYTPIKIKTAMVPVVNFGSSAWLLLFILGMFMNIPVLTDVGIILFALIVAFQLVTLPVEFNASSRAIAVLDGQNMLEKDELRGAKKVLSAAAMTYVASLAVSLAQLLRLIANANRRR